MNRKGILASLMVLSVFAANRLLAFELWNGFTTEMDKTQVIARARKVLNITEIKEGRSNFLFFSPDSNLANSRLDFPEMDLVISCTSSLPAYGNSAGREIKFYIYQNKLFAVFIPWAANFEDLRNRVTENYGEPSGRFSERSPSWSAIQWRREWFRWQNAGWGLYITTDFNSPAASPAALMYVLNVQAQQMYSNEKKQAAEQRRQEEAAEAEARRRRVNEGITF